LLASDDASFSRSREDEPMKIVSGGQTGVDRAALDVAISLGIEYAGWCPRGGLAEDHASPPGLLAAYPKLTETPSDDPRQRTVRNVRDSDATLVLTRGGVVSPGTALTLLTAQRLGRSLHVQQLDEEDAADQVTAWLLLLDPESTLDVAGPRESQAPGVYDEAVALLTTVLAAYAV
jgi:hypothetical protein